MAENVILPTTPLATSEYPASGTTDTSVTMELRVPSTPLRGATFLSDLGIRNVPEDSILLFKRTLSDVIPVENPTTILVLDKASSALQWQTNKFILQQISKPMQERFQLVETFDDPALFFFGEKAKIYTIQGVLLDADYGTGPDRTDKEIKRKNKNQWTQAMQDFYERHLRGTRLLEEGNIAALYINNWYIKGYPFAFNISKESTSMPDGATFHMSWVITDETLLRATKQGNIDYLYKGVQLNAALTDLYNKLNSKLQEWSDYERKLKKTVYNSVNDMNADINTRDKLAQELSQQKAELREKIARYNDNPQKTYSEDDLNYL